MRKIIFIFFLALLFGSCSKPTQFMVKSVRDARTIELEDGTIVKLIGVNGTTNKYDLALQGLENNYITLYDENYDPIKEIYEGNILAYVYDIEGNCINDFAENNGENSGIAETTGQSSIMLGGNNDTEPKERVSAGDIEAMPESNLSELYEKNKYSVFLIAVPQTASTYAQGTGFFISVSCLILGLVIVIYGSIDLLTNVINLDL